MEDLYKNRMLKAIWQIAPHLAITILVLSYYRATWGSVDQFVAAIDHCGILFCDFVRHYYPTGKNIIVTGRPDIAFFYSSFAAVLFVPLGALRLTWAVFIWLLVQISGTAALYTSSYFDLSPLSGREKLFATFCFMTAFPVLHNFKWGQVSIIITLCVTAAFILHERGSKSVSACLLAIAVSIKYYPALFLTYFLLKRDWKFLAFFAAFVFLFLAVVPAAVLGPDHAISLQYTSIGKISGSSQGWIRNDVNSQYLANVVNRWNAGGLSKESRAILTLAGVIIAGLNCLLISLLIRRGADQLQWWGMALLFTSVPFLIPSSWPHYFVFLPLLQVFLLNYILRTTVILRVRYIKTVLFIFPSVLLSNILFFNLHSGWRSYSSAGYLFIANLILLALVYVEAIPLLLAPPKATGVAGVGSGSACFHSDQSRTRGRNSPFNI